MSEFSESWQLRASSQAEGVRLLKDTGVAGFVFPETEGWVTLLIDGPRWESNAALIGGCHGTLLHLMYAEDHGWGFTLYDGGAEVCRFQSSWQGEIVHDNSRMDWTFLNNLIAEVTGSAPDESALREALMPGDLGEMFARGESPCAALAGLLHIQNYEWLDHESFAEEDAADEMGVVEVTPN